MHINNTIPPFPSLFPQRPPTSTDHGSPSLLAPVGTGIGSSKICARSVCPKFWQVQALPSSGCSRTILDNSCLLNNNIYSETMQPDPGRRPRSPFCLTKAGWIYRSMSSHPTTHRAPPPPPPRSACETCDPGALPVGRRCGTPTGLAWRR